MIRKHYTLDTLEDEIYRLYAEGQNIRKKLNNNFEYLESHFASLVMSSVLNKVHNGKERVKEKIVDSIWDDKTIQGKLDQVIEYIVGKTAAHSK